MSWRLPEREARRRIVSATLKRLRALRGVRSRDLASLMGLELRTYERFEAGDVRLEIDRLMRLAQVTDTDALAILSAVLLQRPELATQCADNKLMLVVAQALERLSRRWGDRIRELETSTIIAAVDLAFDALDDELARREKREFS